MIALMENPCKTNKQIFPNIEYEPAYDPALVSFSAFDDSCNPPTNTWIVSNYLTFLPEYGINCYGTGYDITTSESIKVVTMDSDYFENSKRLDEIDKLEYDWNGNGANPIPHDLIESIRAILADLHSQPEIFPTTYDGIEFEFSKPGSILSFILFPDFKLKVFLASSGKKGIIKYITFDVANINKEIDKFYGHRI